MMRLHILLFRPPRETTEASTERGADFRFGSPGKAK